MQAGEEGQVKLAQRLAAVARGPAVPVIVRRRLPWYTRALARFYPQSHLQVPLAQHWHRHEFLIRLRFIERLQVLFSGNIKVEQALSRGYGRDGGLQCKSVVSPLPPGPIQRFQ